MARPKVDNAAMRERFFAAAEAVIRTNGGRKLVLSDIAKTLGMSQSNAYRYFRNRDELIIALADRWFADVERAAEAAVAREGDPEEKIAGWLLATMRQKIKRFDDDPELFRSYLELAKAYPAIVAAHAERILAMTRPAALMLVGAARLDQAMHLLEDATICFRNPYMIAQQRAILTEDRALAVLDAVFLYFRHANSQPGRKRAVTAYHS